MSSSKSSVMHLNFDAIYAVFVATKLTVLYLAQISGVGDGIVCANAFKRTLKKGLC